VLVVALSTLTACASAPDTNKARELTPAERNSLSQILEPLLTAAGLWRGPADGCAAAFALAPGAYVGAIVVPHAPCRIKLVLTEGAFTHIDRTTLRMVLAHEIAHLQLGHPEARQQREEERKRTEKNVKAVSSAGSKAVSFIPGVGGLISKGIGTARKAATAAMEAPGSPYLPEEERAADALTVKYLNDLEASGCGAFATFLVDRLRDTADDVWAVWRQAHPVSAERSDALRPLCPGSTRLLPDDSRRDG
jgi:hypothetical protein